MGLHPDLIRVAATTLLSSPIDYGISEGIRTPQRQHELFLAGKTQRDYPPKAGEKIGRHLTGHAFDFYAFVDGAVSWDLQYYAQIAEAMKTVALKLGILVHWGGDWEHFKDEDHLELDEKAYPDYEPLTA